MKSKRPQKRYESDAQILAMIEDSQFTIKSEGHEIDRLEAQYIADRDWLAARPCSVFIVETAKDVEQKREEWHKHRESMNATIEARDKLRTHRGTLEAKLRLLKEKLAAFNTQPMAFLEDGSTV